MCGFSRFLKQYYINYKHKINLNYNCATVEIFLLNSERGLWYDGRCGWFENFESAIFKSARHFRIESESSDLKSNRILKLCRSLIIIIVIIIIIIIIIIIRQFIRCRNMSELLQWCLKHVKHLWCDSLMCVWLMTKNTVESVNQNKFL